MLSLADMFEVVLAEKPGLVNCVKEQRSQNPDTSGTLKVRWTIQASGQTSDVSVVSEELKDTVMARCVVSLVKGLKFPEHEKQGEPVVFPFKF